MVKLNPPFEEFTVSKYSNPELVAKSDPNQAANVIDGVCAGKVGTCGTEFKPNKTKMAVQNQAFRVASYSNPELVTNVIEGECIGNESTTNKKKGSDSDEKDEKKKSKVAETTVHEKFTGENTNKILINWMTASAFIVLGLFMLWQRKNILSLVDGKNNKLGSTLIFVPLLMGILLLVLFSLEMYIGIDIFKNDAQILFTIAIIIIPILFLIYQYDECLKKSGKNPPSSENKRSSDKRKDRELNDLRDFKREVTRRRDDRRRRWDRDRRVRFADEDNYF